MKYGLCYYKNSENIGDDILTLAGMQYLPQVDYVIDRESLDVFTPPEKTIVSVILNGWYLHNTYAFPPSPYINPLFIGIHFDINLITRSYHYLDGFNSEYLTRYLPIGCRDMSTKEQMDLRNIKSYFSGCLTLTLEKPSEIINTYDIVACDIGKKEMDYITTHFPNRETTITTHNILPEDYCIEWGEKRITRAKELLKIYAGAKLVITKRLHAALPCIAMKTPVILIGNFDEDYEKRLSDYSKYLTIISQEDLFSGKADSLIKSGPKNIYPYDLINGIRNTCKEFINRAENLEIPNRDLPDISFYKENFIERTENMRNEIIYLKEALRQAIIRHDEDVETMRKMVALMQNLTSNS